VAEGQAASRLAWLLALLVTAATVVPFWTCAVVPTQDGPAHLYNAWLLAHFDEPELQAGRFFRVNAFVPNWGGVAPLVPLLTVASPAVAEKMLFSLIALAIVLGAAALAARLGGDPVLASAVAVSIAHGWIVGMGFTGFALGLGLGLLLCTWIAARIAVAGRPPDTTSALVIAVGFVLLFFVHLAAALLSAGIAGVLLAALAWPRREPRRLAVLVVPFLALASLMAAWSLETRGRPAPSYRSDPRGAIGRLLELPGGAFWETYSSADRGLGTAVVVLVLGLVLARTTHNALASRSAMALLLATPVVLIAYLFVPFAVGGGAYLTDRLVPLLLLLPLPWATSEGLPRRGALRAAALLLAAALLAHRGVQYRQWGRAVESLVRLNGGVAPGTLLVQPAWEEPAITGVDPLLHLWGRVAVETRAVPLDDYEAALAGLFPVSYTEEGLALSTDWTRRGVAPAGAAAIRWR
jgi:hypothetical protein